MTTVPRLSVSALVLCGLLAACSDDEVTGAAAGSGGTGPAGAAGTSGAGGAAGSGASGSSGQGGATCGAWPTPRLGQSAEARAVVEAPARCGQPAHQWLEDPSLGQVTATIEGTTRPADLLAVLASGLLGDKAPVPKYDVVTRRITYTTQDRGKLVEATAAVAMPVEPTGKPLDVVAVLHGTTGFTDGCGPSTDGDSVTILAFIASLGYIVVGPDYVGLRNDGGKTGFPHPYLSGQPTAISTLDAVRAAGRMSQELCPSGRYAIIGGSQGGHAALWVDRLAPYYASELDLRGVVATVPPADLLGEGQRALTQLVSASSNTAAFLAVSTPWYGQTDRLDEAFVAPYDTQLPEQLAASCDPGKALDSVKALSDVYQQPLLDAAAAGTFAQQMPFGCITAENGLTTTSIPRINAADPSYGILFVVGESDTLVHTPTERAAYTTLCTEQKMPLQFLECAGASHTKTTTWSLPEILSFTQARLAGEAFTASCQLTDPVTCQGTPKTP